MLGEAAQSFTVSFTGTVMQWRGPAPFYWIPLPEDENADLVEIASELTYGWGCIPVDVQIGETCWYTALMPKDGVYLVPVKAAIRASENIEDGDAVAVELTFGRTHRSR